MTQRYWNFNHNNNSISNNNNNKNNSSNINDNDDHNNNNNATTPQRKNEKIITSLFDDKTLLLLTKCDTLPFTEYNIDTSDLSSSKQSTTDPLYLNQQTSDRAQIEQGNRAYIHEQMLTLEENILLGLGAWSDQ